MNMFQLYSSFFFNCMPNFQFYVLMVCLGLGTMATWLELGKDVLPGSVSTIKAEKVSQGLVKNIQLFDVYKC